MIAVWWERRCRSAKPVSASSMTELARDRRWGFEQETDLGRLADGDGAGIGFEFAGEHFEERGLAGPIGADKANAVLLING